METIMHRTNTTSTPAENIVWKMLDDMAREHASIETRLYEDDHMSDEERARLEARQEQLVYGYMHH